MLLKKIDPLTFKYAIRASLPIVFGYLPTSFIFGFMLVSAGYHFILAPIMSISIFAGAGQYLAVGLLSDGSSYLNTLILTFLINSKHLFYGLSLIEPYKEFGFLKPYMIFSLTDETYAVLTSPIPEFVDKKMYMFIVSITNHLSWIFGSLLGGILGNLIKIPTEGMDFAMTALFLVIIVEQFKNYKSKLPFVIGIGSGLFALVTIGKNQMLLVGSILSIILLILFRKRIEENVTR